MNNTYTLKISPQSQLTLPKKMREQLNIGPGSRVNVSVTNDGQINISSKLPIESRFGSLPNTWTKENQDAADYSRDLRDSMQQNSNN